MSPRYVATLECGEELSFPHSEAVPQVGDQFPCRRHGFCVVTAANRSGLAAGQIPTRVLDYVRRHPGTFRLTLAKATGVSVGVIDRAEKDGLLRCERGSYGRRLFYLAA